jgi:RNA polymerase sigma factor (sigma-70 family)
LIAAPLVDQFFRHEYGRLVATLTRRVGACHIDAVEDAVQSALMAALESWAAKGRPDNPSAWLFRAAHNELMGELRKRHRQYRILEQSTPGESTSDEQSAGEYYPTEVQDDLLRMLFLCCDDALPAESSLVLALKTLCGFDVREIALRMFVAEAAIYKRLARAIERLRSHTRATQDLDATKLGARLPAVHHILYLLFTEGHLSVHPDSAMRRELCSEAIRLTTLLAEHPAGESPETFALLALMHFHNARFAGRQSELGDLILLQDQDRILWDRWEIQLGLAWLARSAQGEAFSRYHAEAGIAAEHCLAPSFTETRWDKIVRSYEMLERLSVSPIHTLNRAVAVAEWQGPAAGLAILVAFQPPPWLATSHMWAAAMADLHRRCGNVILAHEFRAQALGAAPTTHIREMLERRLSM